MTDLPELDGSGEILDYFAQLKGVPLELVLHNAAKDFVYGAYLATPKGEMIPKSDWAYLPGRGTKAGETVKVRISAQTPLEQVRLSKYRLHKPMRGYALSAFIPAFKELDFKRKGGESPAPVSAIRKVWSAFESREMDAFKREIDNYRKAHTAGMSEKDFSNVKESDYSQMPYVEVSVTENSLDAAYPNWNEKAMRAGEDRAAGMILKELQRIMSDPAKNKPRK